ncbi:hypothetical protein ANCCEY_00330 [Ancylostoma ceylanicum]|uniref:Unspecific monooxygenase n=1 Tax=Ancylostoma ceylanicum TaxID=53326 RepID=A0A0D6MBS8_9BILA|nr:hypothetical protein ANCCEY_00330 [Ancylostoma ceylanicum]
MSSALLSFALVIRRVYDSLPFTGFESDQGKISYYAGLMENVDRSEKLTLNGGVNGVVQIDGPKWREQRRFALHVLRDFGVGRALMEGKIMDEVNAFAAYLRLNQRRVAMNSPVAVCVGNVINNMLFGMRFPQLIPQSITIRPLAFAQPASWVALH